MKKTASIIDYFPNPQKTPNTLSAWKRRCDMDYMKGAQKEKQAQKIIEKHLNTTLKNTGKFHTFDWINDEYLIELKSRNCKKNKYPTTMVGMNKINAGLKQIKEGKKVIFIFGFDDGYYKWNLTLDAVYEKKKGGRWDRGMSEIKEYAFIPVRDLICL